MRSRILPAIIVLMAFAQALFAATPAITTFSPAQGPVGTLVTVTGTNLGTPTAFSIGGVTAIVISNTGTSLVGLVMPGATTGVISITTSGGTANSPHPFTITATTYPTNQQGPSLIANEGLALMDYAEQGSSVALSADGNTALVGAANNDGGIGAGFVYTRTGGTWTQQAALVGTGEYSNYSMQGGAVALSADGNTAMIAGSLDGYGGIGAIWFFTRTGTTWTQQGNKVVGTGVIGGSSYQGASVALSADGNTAVEGGPYDNTRVGAAWVFTRSGGVWTQVQKVLATGAVGATVSFGSSIGLSADANTMIVGGNLDNSGVGACWIFTRNGNTYTQQGNKLVGSGAAGAGQQGTAAAISANGNIVCFTGPYTNGAWVFTRTGTVWSQLGGEFVFGGGSPYVPSDGTAVGMSADGNTMLIGGSGDGNGEGATWLFVRNGNAYTQIGNPIYGAQTGGGSNQGAGVAVSANGTTGIIGAPGSNTDQGLAFVLTPVLPTVVTEPASTVAATSATIVGEVTPNGITTTVNFEYGTDPNLDGATTTTTFSLGSNPLAANSPTAGYSSAITGLTPNTTYYYSVNATNVNGATYGNILSFTTPTAPLQPPVISFQAEATVTYGAPPITPGATSTNTVTPITYSSDNTTIATITAQGTIQIVGVGTVKIVASQAAGAGYSAGGAIQTLTVLPAPLLITPNNQTIAEGSAIPILTATYTTFVNGDTQASLTTQATITTTAGSGSAPGQYPITATGAVDPNYTITYAAGTLTIGAGAPIATTMAATSITASGATLNGTVNDNGAGTTVTIQYSTDPALATAVSTATLTTGASPIAAGTGTVAFTSVLTGLAPATTYYFRISGTNSTATTNGSILSFTTAPPVVITFAPPGYVVYGSTTVPVISSTDPSSPIYYRIGNTAVASVTAANDFLATGVGTTYILAYQYAPGTTTIEATAQQNIMVNPAPLTIAAADVTIPWGQPAPAFTATYTGFVNGDTQASLPPGALPVFSTPYGTGSPAGNYNIFSSPNAISNGGNYNITYATSTLTVTPVYPQPTAGTDPATAINSTGATINGMADDNGAATTVTLQYTDDDGDGLQDLITATLTTGPGTLPAGSGNTNYAAILTGLQPGTTYYFIITASNPEFSATGNVLTFTTPAVLGQVITFTAPASAVYGAADLTPNGTSSNSNIPITYTSSNTAVATITSGGNIHIVSAGTTTITASQAAGSGFTAATPVSLTFTVNPAPLTVTAGSTTAVYGAGIPPLSVTYNGFVGNDSVDSLTTRATVSTTAIGDSGAGNYPTTASGASDPNYTITYVAGNLSITPAALTITANNQSMTTGAAVPALTVSYSGFVNDDGAGNLATQPTVTTTATSSSVAGTYPITVSGAVDPNYTITYVAGVLTVNGPFVFNPLPAKTYGDADFSPGAMGTNVTYSSGSTTIAIILDGGNIHIVGAGTSVITATSNGVSLQQTLTVSPAPLTITAADVARVYNAANPDFTFNYTGFVYSDNAASLTAAPVGATTAATTSDVGSYPITVSGASDPNYTITYVGGTLTINKAPQTIGFTTIPDQTINGKYDLSPVNASSGLPVSFALTDPTIAMISGSTLTSLQVGTETLTASQAGNDNYLPAANVSQTFNIIDDSGNDIIVNQVVSPNGDGIDDILNIKNIENYPKNKLALVNRDGIMIYQASGYNNTTTAFDGHSNITGALQQQGTLLYILEYWANGQYHRKTGFTVLRY